MLVVRVTGLLCRRCLRSFRQTAITDPHVDSEDGSLISNAEMPVGRKSVRRLPKSIEDYERNMKCPVQQPPDAKLLTVSVIGMPNAGKSSLTNSLVGTNISAASKKVHTTRRNVIGTLVHDSTQIVFSDSPGLVLKDHCVKHRLEHTFITQPVVSVSQADVIMAVVDASNKRERRRLSAGIIEKLSLFPDKPSILVLNKIDCLKSKRRLFDISSRLTDGKLNGKSVVDVDPAAAMPDRDARPLRQLAAVEKRIREKGYLIELPRDSIPFSDSDSYCGNEDELQPSFWGHFSRIFMVSALTGDGVDDLRQYLLSLAKPGQWQFAESVITTQSPEHIVLTAVRAQMLQALEHELPYVTRLKIDSWCVNRTGTLCIAIDLVVPAMRYASRILGQQGQLVARIASDSRQELSNIFKCDISLKLVVRCQPPRK